MTAAEFVHTELKRLHRMFDTSLAELTPEQLHAVPAGSPKANHIAWNLWHVARTEDNVVRFVVQNRRPTVWAEGGYADKLGLPPVNQGTGMSTEDAHALRIKDVGLFREYMQQVWVSTDAFVAMADAAAFARTVTVKPLGDMPVVRALGQICVSHAMTHVGEMELARMLVGAQSASHF